MLYVVQMYTLQFSLFSS